MRTRRREFLLERTRDERARADDDAASARESRANSAGSRSGSNRRAPISRPSASASRAILSCGARSREKVLDWFDRRLTSYDDVGLADDLGDVGRKALSRKPPPARPPRHTGAGPDPRFAARRRGPRRGDGL